MMGSNPLARNYRTQDGHELAFTCLQAAKYWPSICAAIDRPDLADDPATRIRPRCSRTAARRSRSMLTEVFASAPVAEWRKRLADFDGQWTVVQDTLEAAEDPQTVANGYLQDCETAGGVPFKLVSVPVQYDGEPGPVRRAPEFNEHGDDILAELGYDWDAIVDLKVRGVTA
jgi:crotonobetainyl-CoA:carnitine CoA-transferase CaiB-like acyl-CoA transferase